MKKPLNQLKNVKRKLVEPIIAPARRRRQARIDQKKELDILFGEQDAIDVLSYAGLEEKFGNEIPVSSFSSLIAACSKDSPCSTPPPGVAQYDLPASASFV